MCWILWLKWNMESLSNVPSLENTLAPVNAEMNGSETLGALSSHGLIEIHRHSGVEKTPWES